MFTLCLQWILSFGENQFNYLVEPETVNSKLEGKHGKNTVIIHLKFFILPLNRKRFSVNFDGNALTSVIDTFNKCFPFDHGKLGIHSSLVNSPREYATLFLGLQVCSTPNVN